MVTKAVAPAGLYFLYYRGKMFRKLPPSLSLAPMDKEAMKNRLSLDHCFLHLRYLALDAESCYEDILFLS